MGGDRLEAGPEQARASQGRPFGDCAAASLRRRSASSRSLVAIMPPPIVFTIFEVSKLKVPARPIDAVARPPTEAPSECAQSSITTAPRDSAIRTISRMRQGTP
jgi:hypothetical protein